MLPIAIVLRFLFDVGVAHLELQIICIYLNLGMPLEHSEKQRVPNMLNRGTKSGMVNNTNHKKKMLPGTDNPDVHGFCQQSCSVRRAISETASGISRTCPAYTSRKGRESCRIKLCLLQLNLIQMFHASASTAILQSHC